MPDILEKGQTPEAWSDLLKEHGVHVSPRLIRSKARKTGDFFKIGRLMLLTPHQIEKLFDSSTTDVFSEAAPRNPSLDEVDD